MFFSKKVDDFGDFGSAFSKGASDPAACVDLIIEEHQIP
jgi:hypothetical protein